MLTGKYHNPQYEEAFEQLKKDVFSVLTKAGLAVEIDGDIMQIPIGDTGESIRVEISRIHSRERWAYLNPNARYTGVRISYIGTWVQQYKKYLKPKYHNGVWGFDSKVLVAKTKAALEHARSVLDDLQKESDKEGLIKLNTVRAFMEYYDPDIEHDRDQPLQIHGERVRIKTDWGTLAMSTSDGEVFTIQRIDFNDSLHPLYPESIEAMLRNIGYLMTLKRKGKANDKRSN